MEEKTTRYCPFCKKEIPLDAQKCSHCGEWVVSKSNGCFGCLATLYGLLTIIVAIILSEGSFGMGLLYWVALLIAFAIYFFPTQSAEKRNHPATTAIFFVNLFFGATLIGWIAALVWAFSGGTNIDLEGETKL